MQLRRCPLAPRRLLSYTLLGSHRLRAASPLVSLPELSEADSLLCGHQQLPSVAQLRRADELLGRALSIADQAGEPQLRREASDRKSFVAFALGNFRGAEKEGAQCLWSNLARVHRGAAPNSESGGADDLRQIGPEIAWIREQAVQGKENLEDLRNRADEKEKVLVEVADADADVARIWCGDLRAVLGDAENAERFYEEAAGFEGNHKEIAQIRLAGMMCLRKDRKALDVISEVVKSCENLNKPKHWLGFAICQAGWIFHQMGEAVLAEGLYRKGIEVLNSSKLVKETSIGMLELADAVNGYAILLRDLEWNGRSRFPEGKKALDELRGEIEIKFPELVHGSQRMTKKIDLWEYEFLLSSK